jgi:hypothetical protein
MVRTTGPAIACGKFADRVGIDIVRMMSLSVLRADALSPRPWESSGAHGGTDSHIIA